MNEIYNFGAGPGCLPTEVLNQIREDIPNWYDGMSVMELSHRLDKVMDMAKQTQTDLRQLLSIPDEFAVLFMHGGARGQFSAIPMNLLNGKTANYLITGHWSKFAFDEAKKYCQPHCVANNEALQYRKISDPIDWIINKEAAYFHYTDNETIHGVEFPFVPSIENQWLVTDMTSNLLTKPIDFSRFGLIYASAQKNLGIAGITVVIVRKELMGKAHPLTPSILDYDVTYQQNSMLNTPPVFCWYVMSLVLKWSIKMGGVAFFTKNHEQKSKLIYDVIDESPFYANPIYKPHRSRVNIPFTLPTSELESLFLKEANKMGLKQLKGHKAVGGCRASLYNAMPLDGVKKLSDFMKAFANEHA